MRQTLKEFRDPELVRGILAGLMRKLESRRHPLTLMEVCGTHTEVFSSSGLRDLLRDRIDLRSGPGCPVCVTSTGDLDRMIALARRGDHTVCTFGDMLRVPGSGSSLRAEKTRGADVRVVYSPGDAVELARRRPGRRVVFLAVGFETTAPGVALALRRAIAADLFNFSLYSGLKVLVPALELLLDREDVRLDGLILPGHVSAVVGRSSLRFVARKYRLPSVIAGFEPVDLVHALDLLTDMITTGSPAVKNAYPRAVREHGNRRARQIVREFFRSEASRWRGLGRIAGGGLRPRPPHARWDAAPLVEGIEGGDEPRGCRCGEVLTGGILPPECPLFRRACRPRDPVGPCMVSSEGACAAYDRYHREEAPHV